VKRGAAAEDFARRFLETRGLTLLARNFACPLGEIDLIMKQEGVVVFVEVRYRRSDRYGTPAETITQTKRRKLRRTAELFIKSSFRDREPPCRFDVIGITGALRPENVHWIQNASI
jgi:putative endonuclease